MMQELLNHARRVATEVAGTRAVTRQGTIDGYDPNNFAVRVKLQPDGTLTDWIPLKTAWAGNGWGLFLAPSIGDVVEVDFQEADGGVGSAGWRFFNDSERPLPVPSGEAWLVHQTGSFLKLHNDGSVEINTAGDLNVTVGGFANVTCGQANFSGNVQVSGNLACQSGATGSFTTPMGDTVHVQEGIITNIY